MPLVILTGNPLMQRRFREEQMDRPEQHAALLDDDLRNLEVLNRLFGGRSVVRRRVGEILDRLPAGEPISVLDVGSGAGDLCMEIAALCRSKGRCLRLVSVDLHPAIQARARRRLGLSHVRFAISDAARLGFRAGSFDLALCTLMLHHFQDDEAVQVLAELRRVSRGWVLVSDLVRSPIAYAAVWFATRFTVNPMTRFDGPVSVERAFTGDELLKLASRAGWKAARLIREPWFRASIQDGGSAA